MTDDPLDGCWTACEYHADMTASRMDCQRCAIATALAYRRKVEQETKDSIGCERHPVNFPRYCGACLAEVERETAEKCAEIASVNTFTNKHAREAADKIARDIRARFGGKE